jgi:hypothetical protein
MLDTFWNFFQKIFENNICNLVCTVHIFFYEEKIRWAVNGFGSYKTAGEDEIFPGLLQQGIETLVVPYVKYSRLV